MYCQEVAAIVNSDLFTSSDQPYLCACVVNSMRNLCIVMPALIYN